MTSSRTEGCSSTHSPRRPRGFRRVLRLLTCAGLVGLTLVPATARAVVSTAPEPFAGVAGDDGAIAPTVDARVHAILEAHGRIYIGGEFTRVVLRDGTTVQRRNLIALDAATGALDPTFNPDPANAVRAFEISPDGSRLYVAGPFVRMNGDTRQRLAAIDATTGATIGGWQVDADAPVWSLELSADGILYAGGMFTNLTDAAGTRPRGYLAAIDAAAGRVIDNWRADTVGYTETAPVLDANGNPVCATDPATGQPVMDPNTGRCVPVTQTIQQPGFVRALQMSHDGSRLLVGGEFQSVGGVGQRNLVALDPRTAAVDRRFNAGLSSQRRVFAIAVDAERVYTAHGGGGGEGRALDPVTGRQQWAVNGNGDFQAVAVIGDVAYFGGHFGTTDPGSPFEGQPRNKLAAVDADTGDVLPFAPDFNSRLGVWTLHVSGHNLQVGGDFTRVGNQVGDQAPDAPASHYARLTAQPEPPEPPSGMTAAADDRQVTLRWTAPAWDGLRPITGYVVTPYRAGEAQAPLTFASVATEQIITGLDNGVAYTFTVAAINDLGQGKASALSAEVTPFARPSMAEPPVAEPGNGEIRLSWAAAADDGGSPVTGYVVTPYRAGEAQPPREVPAADRSTVFTGLANGVPYVFTVAATNAVGTGQPSPPSAASAPRTIPGIPRDVTGAAGGGQVTVRWAPPDDGGSPVTAWVVTPYRDGVAGTPRQFTSAMPAGVVTGLDDGAAYTFTVAAVNAAGQGGTSAASRPVIPRSGYWMVDTGGKVYPFGQVGAYGDPAGQLGKAQAVDVEPTPSAQGYWILDDAGHVYGYGDAPYFGGVTAGGLAPGERATGLSASPTGAGYWIFTSRGRVVARGDAPHLGDVSGTALNAPVLDSITTPSGRGYYMVAADGGIFTFGDAVFAGSMGGQRLNAPVMSMAPDPDGDGYWLVASDGGIFAFGAGFFGSMGDVRLNQPVTGMVANGRGYLLVATDGGIFNFSDRPFHGSLGGNPPRNPITAVAAL